MHTVELLDRAVETAQSWGFEVRFEWLEGAGGACSYAGRRRLFVDLGLPVVEQLEQVLQALEAVDQADQSEQPACLPIARLLRSRAA